jgi:carbamoyltransferase
MNVLGLNIYGHDTAAALVMDGNLIAAVEEERLTRVKHERRFPFHSIEYCLKEGNITLDDIDILAVSKDFDKLFKEKYLQYTIDNYPKANGLFLGGLDNIKEIMSIDYIIKNDLGYIGTVEYCLHHLCHVASSYFLSGFKDAALLSVDGLGEIDSTLLGYAVDGKINVINTIKFPHSLGMLYQAFTYYLGYKPNFSEGTVMALASFGDENAKSISGKTYIDIFREMIKLHDDGTFEINLEFFNYPYKREGWVSDKIIQLLGPMRKQDDEITQRHKDIAAALQKIFSKTYMHLIISLYNKTRIKNLCIAGGCALNCAFNGKLLSESPFEDIYIQPAASDSGTAIGAALLTYQKYSEKKLKRRRVNTTYLGPEYTNVEIKKVLDRLNISYEYIENIEYKGAELIYNGYIIGWFQGRMEFGPRALGNRSILSSPFSVKQKDYINKFIKHRELFRPFAPSVLEEFADKYFEINCSSPFMLFAVKVKHDKVKAIEAVVHVDNTARIQTVSKATNKLYYNLIYEFYKLSGVPVVLNTSFNDRGEPIVCSPIDAINTFYTTKLDYLIIGNYLLSQNENSGLHTKRLLKLNIVNSY